MRLPVAHCLEEKAKKNIAGSTDRLNFASEKNKSRFVLTQKKELITIKKNTIMKAMEFTPATAAKFESSTMAAQVSDIKKSVKKFIKATCRFFMVISPAYPQYVESLRKG